MGDRSRKGRRRSNAINVLKVRRIAAAKGRYILMCGAVAIPCTIGSAGVTNRKREGDGATPIGRFRLLHGFYRADRFRHPISGLKLRALHTAHGWCDDPASACYNRAVALPFGSGHERLWRDDHVYDYVIVLDHNRMPRVRGHGSAIFLHIMRPDAGPTAGCVAIGADAMRRLLPRLTPRTRLVIA